MRRALALLLLSLAASAGAQEARPDSAARASAARDTLDRGAVAADTLARGALARDTLQAGDRAGRDTVDAAPIVLPVPAAPAAEGGLERPVAYTATDSLRVVLAPRDAPADSVGDVVSLFGNVQSQYDDATIAAGQVDYDARLEVLRASPLASDSGEVGRPQFNGEEGEFSGRTFTYNLRTQRGRVTGARTQLDDGFLLGGVIKQQDAHVVFAQDAAYTTCALDHPHYAVEAGRIKVVDGERVFTGPVQLKLFGLPMPVALPFGFFPAAEGRRSGPLPVRYGQDTNFGLLLDNLGWYWALSDYLDAQVAGKVGTQGSFQLTGGLRYNRRYSFSGQASLEVGRLRSGESTDPGFSPRTPIGLRWTHNQTFPAGQKLTANVNLQTVSQRLASNVVSEQIQTTTRSAVTYNQQWPSAGRTLTVSTQAYQDFRQNRTSVTLPQLTFSQQRRFPFRRGRDDRWWEKISLSYDANAQNAFQYAPYSDSTGISALDALFSPTAFREGACDPARGECSLTRFDYQVVQRVPVSAAFSVPRFNLTLSPSVNYVETWADQAVTQTYVDSTRSVRVGADPGFTAVRQVSVSASAATEFYGTFPIRVGALEGVRHTVTPQVSLSYQPDYEAFGFVREVQADSTGRTRRYAIHPSIPVDPTRTLSFSVANAFVARTVRTDSTGAEQRQTRQVLALNVSSGYNFGADRLRFQPVSANFTSTFAGATASGNLSFSVYAPDEDLSRLPLTYFDVTGRPLRLTGANFRLNRTFQSGRRTGPRDERPIYDDAPGALYDPTATAPRSAAIGYVDYSAPWSVSLGLNLFRSIPEFGDARTTATLDVTGFQAQLTPNWSLGGSTGFDLTSLDVTQTRLSLRRDLHCWEMSVDWQPIGTVKQFSVSLYVKSGFLRDFLRLDVPNSTVRARGLGGIPGGGIPGGGF